MPGTSRRLTLSWIHLAVVGVFWLIAAGLTVNSCLISNGIAGRTNHHSTSRWWRFPLRLAPSPGISLILPAA